MPATLAQVLAGAVTAASQVAVTWTWRRRPPRPATPTDVTADVRDAEAERVLALGATLFEDHRRPDRTGWVVLAAPEGNEFCIERGVPGG